MRSRDNVIWDPMIVSWDTCQSTGVILPLLLLAFASIQFVDPRGMKG